MSKIIAGPWVGEFGWELFGWQGYLRYLSKTNEDQIVVISRPGHRHLYNDFCVEFIEYDPGGQETDASTLRDELNRDKINQVIEDYKSKGYEHLKGSNSYYGENQSFVQFGYNDFCDVIEKFDILLHARSTDKCGTNYRNWPDIKWAQLCMKLSDYKIGFIGSKEGSKNFNEIDLRGLRLSMLCYIMRHAKVIVGPSSGPMHLASLCSTPHVVWSAKNTVALIDNRKRYETEWNPLKTKVNFIDEEGWDPNVETVYNKIIEFL